MLVLSFRDETKFRDFTVFRTERQMFFPWFFHIFTCILHHLRVYYELSSVGRALHRYRKRHGFRIQNSFQVLILQLLSCENNCDKQLYLRIFLPSSNISSFIYSLILQCFFLPINASFIFKGRGKGTPL